MSRLAVWLRLWRWPRVFRVYLRLEFWYGRLLGELGRLR